MNTADPHNLTRFLEAQNGPAGSLTTYDQACAELRAGQKQSHWMWFIFPQLKGLGSSPMSTRFAIGSVQEAEAYIQHPVLGTRLIEATQIVNDLEGRNLKKLTADQIFGGIDAMKFRSSMTLFAHAAPINPVFAQALNKYFAGQPDRLTINLLNEIE